MRAPYMAEPGSFEPLHHYYPRVANTHLHPLVRHFLSLGNDRIAERYCHLHPEARPSAVRGALADAPRYLRWAGADLLTTTNEKGVRRLIVVEVNSSPSGQKSMPLIHEEEDRGGYRRLLEKSFVPMLKRRGLPEGGLAVIYDKNAMEATGYAAVIADLTGEPVACVPMQVDREDPDAVFEDGVLRVRVDGRWRRIRAAFRYVTQRPWTRVPPMTRTLVYNPVVACLAGGRNKLLAAKAYDLHNGELRRSGLKIRVPETIWDVDRSQVPMWVERFGGFAVVKVPYANAGQGVYTITNPAELDAFMATELRYDRLIVQGLVGNLQWSSRTREGSLYHLGTVPDRKNQIYVCDIRMMIGAGGDGYFPVACYARRAKVPLPRKAPTGIESWDVLGTNLSLQLEDGSFTTEPERLVLMDSRDFNRLGLGIDDLIEGYLQTVMATSAIDRMACRLVTKKNSFRHKLFSQMVPDARLNAEVIR